MSPQLLALKYEAVNIRCAETPKGVVIVMLPGSAISRANYRQSVLSKSRAYLRTTCISAAVMAKEQPKDEPHPKFKHLPLATSGALECALSVRQVLAYRGACHS